ncbi:hypothetical protein C8F04DRAFT_1257253 [Mycena alexandri]|uniref:Secreted protein n=1 Tax=Mycena alexandri TaxID=1745969 RepID=A0AAD6T229_9AGAR|nr:hypothetical protein C8F04DRAFT_1257253 [Mycena alexandri]
MSHLHILVVFMSALLVGLATSTRCQPTSLAELKAMPFWQTFYDRLGVVVWGQPVGSFMFDLVGFNIDTTFDDGDGARACSIETVSFQTIGEPICYVTTTYSKESAIPPSGPLTIDYPTGFSTVVAGTVTKVAAPVTDGKVYDRSFIVQDATPIVNSTAGLTRQYQANGLYSDTLGNRCIHPAPGRPILPPCPVFTQFRSRC